MGIIDYKAIKKNFNDKQLLIDSIKKEYLENNDIKLKYITSTTAFNIPYNGILCDWHSASMLHSDKYKLHPIDIIGAEVIFGDYGLYDCSQYFKNNNRDIEKSTGTNLCATPIRAIIDILFYNIGLLEQYPTILANFHSDYMMDEIDHKELESKLTILRENFNLDKKAILDEWIDKELLNKRCNH